MLPIYKETSKTKQKTRLSSVDSQHTIFALISSLAYQVIVSM